MIDINIDTLEFMGGVVDAQMEVLTSMDELAALMPSMAGGVADIARDHLHDAQIEVDRLVAADDTWRPA